MNTSGSSVDAVANDLSDQISKAYRAKSDAIGPENMSKIESFVYMQVIDRAWKNHLLAMDTLKDSVSLRGYGQRDPLQEYKKEAFRMFEQMMHQIEEETAKSLIQLEPPKSAAAANALMVEEPDEDELTMVHPSAQAYENNTGDGSSAAGKPAQPADGLIYHGSRSAPPSAEPRQQPQTFKREMPKVGRNDPCPCGSNKKYKKCHGVADSEDQPTA